MSDEDWKSIATFCSEKNISKSSWYELEKRGLAPETFNIGRIRRITPAAEKAWAVRMAKLAKSKSARLEAARRRENAVIAGKAAAQSPRHISRRGAHGRRGR